MKLKKTETFEIRQKKMKKCKKNKKTPNLIYNNNINIIYLKSSFKDFVFCIQINFIAKNTLIANSPHRKIKNIVVFEILF